MQKIIPHLWFDKEAKEATVFYTEIFEDSEVTDVTTLHDTPSGDCEVVSFNLLGCPFMAISAGRCLRLTRRFHFSSTLIRPAFRTRQKD